MESTKFEWNRQFFHIALGTAIVALLIYDILDKTLILAITLLGLILSYLNKRTKIPIIYFLLQKFERKEELKHFPGKGIIFYFLGSYAALLLFPKDAAMASIMVLAMGDSISHIFGISYGRTKHPLSKTKYLEGTIAGIAAGFIGAFVFLPWHEALVASIAGMIVEAIEIKIKGNQFDDNLLIPVASGAAIYALRMIL